MSVRVRFAPSPTGYLHVGGLRTALYNYMFAKHLGGTCVLRIEDTDRTRLVENAQENLVQSLRWAGIEFDESPEHGGEYGPYVQSERFDLYKKYADYLLENDKAYYAFDTPEELAEMRERLQKEKKDPRYDRDNMRNQYTLGDDETKKILESDAMRVVRLKVPHDVDIRFKDLIRKDIKVKGREVDDQILLKSDGFPTYHLANVVDDHLMGITHVIRGEEWLPSTPKHVLLYDAFGWDRPEFAHLPLLLNKKKAKLSKRHGDVAVEDFRAKGYIKDAFVNFIALLGWNPSADQEIFSIDELIDKFDITKVNKGGAVFDTQKLEWMNAQYLRKQPTEALAKDLIKILDEKGISDISEEYAERCVKMFIERVNFLHEIPVNADYMFGDIKEYEEKYINKHWKEDTAELVKPLLDIFKNDAEFTHDSTYKATQEYVESKEMKLKVIIHPLRLMITGKSAGAGMFETMEILGKDECVKRIESFLGKKESGEL